MTEANTHTRNRQIFANRQKKNPLKIHNSMCCMFGFANNNINQFKWAWWINRSLRNNILCKCRVCFIFLLARRIQERHERMNRIYYGKSKNVCAFVHFPGGNRVYVKHYKILQHHKLVILNTRLGCDVCVFSMYYNLERSEIGKKKRPSRNRLKFQMAMKEFGDMKYVKIQSIRRICRCLQIRTKNIHFYICECCCGKCNNLCIER